jgi:hypothetical protein
MATIYVKAKPGRRAFIDGKQMPTDDFKAVPDTPYVRRLIQHWGDLEVQGELPPLKPKGGSSPTAPRPQTQGE